LRRPHLGVNLEKIVVRVRESVDVVFPFSGGGVVGPAGCGSGVKEELGEGVAARTYENWIFDQVGWPGRRVEGRQRRASVAVDADLIGPDCIDRQPGLAQYGREQRAIDPVNAFRRDGNLEDGAG